MNRPGAALVRSYLAQKQHLLPAHRLDDVVQTTRDVIALHATSPTGPFLSLWARVPDFRQERLEQALYERRDLVRLLSMRNTLHVMPSDEAPYFIQACRHFFAQSQDETLLVLAGLCSQQEASGLLEKLQRRVLDVLTQQGPSTVQAISRAVPELGAKIRHSAGKSYAGEFSVGSRLVPAMCSQGLLVRARPRGTWRSNLYEYAPLADWLSGIELASVSPSEARTWLVRRYLSTFGPATPDDVQWWTGFARGDTLKALAALGPDVVEVSVEPPEDGYLMLAGDAQRLADHEPPDPPYVFFLPALDPYVMGYRDRSRFLAAEHRAKVIDRAGNVVATVWIDGRVAGAWGQRQDGRLVYRLFESAGPAELALLETEAERLAGFLDGEYLRPLIRTSFSRSLGAPPGKPD
jgi:hypothetical protein